MWITALIIYLISAIIIIACIYIESREDDKSITPELRFSMDGTIVGIKINDFQFIKYKLTDNFNLETTINPVVISKQEYHRI